MKPGDLIGIVLLGALVLALVLVAVRLEPIARLAVQIDRSGLGQFALAPST